MTVADPSLLTIRAFLAGLAGAGVSREGVAPPASLAVSQSVWIMLRRNWEYNDRVFHFLRRYLRAGPPSSPVASQVRMLLAEQGFGPIVRTSAGRRIFVRDLTPRTYP